MLHFVLVNFSEKPKPFSYRRPPRAKPRGWSLESFLIFVRLHADLMSERQALLTQISSLEQEQRREDANAEVLATEWSRLMHPQTDIATLDTRIAHTQGYQI